MSNYNNSVYDFEVYPKVLIIGESFHTNSGGGITQSNLFRSWPKGNLAIIPYVKDKSDPSVCNRIYSIHEKEVHYLFPFNLINSISQRVKQSDNKVQNSNLKDKTNQWFAANSKDRGDASIHQAGNITGQKRKAKTFEILKRIYRSIKGFFGIDHIKSKIVVSTALLNWIEEFNPDLIYAQFAELDKIRFVYNLKSATNLPLVIHFMDDWPSVLVSPGIFRNYWKRIINMELRRLIEVAGACIAISEKMADEYKIRYNRDFSYFHNPVDIDTWLPYSKTCWEVGSTFRILYAGRAGQSIIQSLKTIAKSVQKIHMNDINVEFHIYTKDFIEARLLFNNMSTTNVHEPIPDYSQLPHLFSSYDLLLIPLDFETRFLTLSMPTKVSEYMICGTPILVYAPKNTALAEYALKYQWGYVIDNDDPLGVENAILNFFYNEQKRREYGLKAKEIALSKHDSNKVRANFKKLLYSQISNEKIVR